MNKRFTTVLAILLGASIGVVYGQPDPLSQSLDELERARALLNDRQDRLGPMDAGLIEPIEQLADQLMSLNQFDEAHVLLDRAIQIARVQNGLYTERQRDLLTKKIDNFANRGDWESARENMEHLLWLYTQKSVQVDQALVDDLMSLSQVHLRGLAEDSSFMQGYHFRKSAQIRWIALGVAEVLWGDTDERLVPIVYEQLRQLHLQTVALWRGGVTSYALRRVAPGSEIMRDRADINETFYVTGLSFINKLYSIYAHGEMPNAEGMAMTNVYLADWQILYDQPQQATDTYRQAYRELLSAGVELSRVNELFSQPIVIPDTQFHASVDAAISALNDRLEVEEEGSSNPYLSFSEWSSALPNVRSPISSSSAEAQELDSNFAFFSFSLAGVNRASRWYSHRFVSTVNMIEQAELLTHYLEAPPQELQLLEKLNSLTFRPKLVDGEPQQATGRLKYHIAE